MVGLSWWQLFRVGESVIEPHCSRTLASAAFRCIGLLGYGSGWDRLVPVWLVILSFLTGVCCALSAVFICHCIVGRTKGAVEPSEEVPVLRNITVDAAAPVSISDPPPPTSGSQLALGGRGVPRLRRGGGALA
jgi:hypothetical protein